MVLKFFDVVLKFELPRAAAGWVLKFSQKFSVGSYKTGSYKTGSYKRRLRVEVFDFEAHAMQGRPKV